MPIITPESLESPQERPPKLNSISTPRKLLFVFLKCIIMAFILSLFLLFLGFAAVILIHFVLTTTAFRRRRRHRRDRSSSRASAGASSPYSSPDQMDRLPCINYSSSAHLPKDCAICLDSFREDEPCRKLPACNHLFHMKCVDHWLGKVLNCPICRTRVVLDSSGSNLSNEDWKTWWVVGV